MGPLYYARSRLGTEAQTNFNEQRAHEEFDQADRLLRKAAGMRKEPVRGNDRRPYSRLYRALVLNLDRLILAEQKARVRVRTSLVDELFSFLDDWLQEYPQDEHATKAYSRLAHKYTRQGPHPVGSRI